MTGLIFDIQGHSVHDGPGCRTVVFMSGCPLRCQWCSNPEGLSFHPQMLFRERLCEACPTRCVAACPRGAMTARALGPAVGDRESGSAAIEPLVSIDRVHCVGCRTFNCVSACYRQALQVSGRDWTVDALMGVLSRDQAFWGHDGGVTFGGGEPLAQKPFLTAVLERCRAISMHTAIETSAALPWTEFAQILPLVSWLFVDLKHIDDARHREGTSVGNEMILDNLVRLAAAGWRGRLVVRTTIVPGFNDDPAHAAQAASFLAAHRIGEVNLLPFHRLGTSKYSQLGQRYAYADDPPPTAGLMDELATIYRAAGLVCHVGAETSF